MSEMQERIEDYLGMGVRTVWVIDPQRRRAYQTEEGGVAVPVREYLTSVETAVQVSIKAMFAELKGFGAGV